MTSRGRPHNVLMACLCLSLLLLLSLSLSEKCQDSILDDIPRPETEDRTDFVVCFAAYGLRLNFSKNKTNKAKQIPIIKANQMYYFSTLFW